MEKLKSKTQVIFVKPAVLAAVHRIGPYKQTVHKAWGSIFEWLDKTKPDPMPDHAYGLTYDDPRKVPQEQLRYVAGVVMPSNWWSCPTKLVLRTQFDGGTFLRTRVVGPYKEVGKVISTFRDQWIPKHGLVFDRNNPVLTIYRSDTRVVAPDEQVADVCLPVFADRRSEPRD